MTISRRTKWMIAAALLAGAGIAMTIWYEDLVRALIYHQPLRYDQPFHPAVAVADRIVVRGDGYDCCNPINETNILFVVTDPDEVAAVRSNIAFVAEVTTNAFMETCMCCGGPGIDWYNGSERVAVTAMQHGHSIRWHGFSTSRLLGYRFGYGDGPLTETSRIWVNEWFKSHGVETAAASPEQRPNVN